MTNFDQALAVLESARRPGELRIHPHDAVEALANAGLLAPDLPEANDAGIIVPGGKGWLPCGLTGPSVWTAPGGRVMVQRVEPGDLTPAEARFFALAVLAAAQYSKEKA
ncbi:hypothetical protein HMPREF2604_07430 [Corynebacterium sp. HMSC055A01]|uniref:hypothetical protein n=1 Tax=Corynebacterium sp. HMSC055A01 TaxID=1715083 RepID=UPI0008A57C6F|nr:hypothetical protein [Corynebacterium sp. HMSC055A01]OFN17763.1 hypothetical protein HMPREF2604_07430 [Corynebacterium sp. HMSC055A01]